MANNTIGAWLVTLGLVVACRGGEDQPPSDARAVDAAPDADPRFDEACRRACEHRIVTCGAEEEVAACAADCRQSFDHPWLRHEPLLAIVECQAELPCGADNNACLAVCRPTAAHEQFEARCRAVFSTCGRPADVDWLCETTPTGVGETGDLNCLLTTSIIDELSACVPSGATCDPADDCIDGVFVAHDVNF